MGEVRRIPHDPEHATSEYRMRVRVNEKWDMSYALEVESPDHVLSVGDELTMRVKSRRKVLRP